MTTNGSPRELVDGIWRWTARHPEWHPSGFGDEVAGFALRVDGGGILVDPLLPSEPADVLALVDELARERLTIVISVPYHVRSAEEIWRRHPQRTTIHGHPAAANRLRDTSGFRPIEAAAGGREEGAGEARGGAGGRGGGAGEARGGAGGRGGGADHGGPGARGGQAAGGAGGQQEDALRDAGVSAYPIGKPRRHEQPLYIHEHDALVFGDTVVEVDGALRVWNDPLSDEKRTRWYRERYIPTFEPLLDLRAGRVLVTHGEPVLKGGAKKLKQALKAEPWSRHTG